jgi:hypothetical protein
VWYCDYSDYYDSIDFFIKTLSGFEKPDRLKTAFV